MNVGSLFACALFLVTATTAAAESGSDALAQGRLALAMKDATISLKDGLRTGASVGTPISAQFDIDEGQLRCFVFVKKEGEFIEVCLDPKGGKILFQDPVTDTEELVEIRKQAVALARAHCQLIDVLIRAETANPGYRVISVLSGVGGSEELAEFEMMKGVEFKYVDERLQRPQQTRSPNDP